MEMQRENTEQSLQASGRDGNAERFLVVEAGQQASVAQRRPTSCLNAASCRSALRAAMASFTLM